MYDDLKLELFWSDIPIGKDKAVDYQYLIDLWGVSERGARAILHQLSHFDNGDNYVLIRSSTGKGFYRTDDTGIISKYRKECLNKGKSIFAPLKKIDRILKLNTNQYSFENNLRVVREEKNLKQSQVSKLMKEFDRSFDNSLLSKMENGVCLPTPLQLNKLALIYNVPVTKLINVELY